MHMKRRGLTVSLFASLSIAMAAGACSPGGGDEAPSSGDGMVVVPGGIVHMGTLESDIARLMAATGVTHPDPFLAEVPPRDVEVAGFLIDATEVTNRDFAAFVAANPEWSRERADTATHNGEYLAHWVDGAPPEPSLDEPAIFVSWYAGVAYCRWRGKRLPTEAEWEHAAKGGATSAEYPWGDEPPDTSRVNYGASGHDRAIRVASYPPNALGIFDMAGNVWEFLADPWYGTLAETPERVPALDPDTAGVVRTRRVVRGGSWGANAANLRTRYRDSHRPWHAADIVGFRCARSMER